MKPVLSLAQLLHIAALIGLWDQIIMFLSRLAHG